MTTMHSVETIPCTGYKYLNVIFLRNDEMLTAAIISVDPLSIPHHLVLLKQFFEYPATFAELCTRAFSADLME